MTVFVIAMQSEAQPLIEKMQAVKKDSAHGRDLFFGTLSNKPLAVIVCGVGKVNAAAATQYAIDVLGAEKIVNIGVAGGLNAGTETGGLYSVSHAVQYDFDLTQLNGTPMGTLNEYDEPYLPLAVCPLFEAKKLASGDRFNDDKKDYELLSGTLGADLRDMEGGAIAHVCRHAGVAFYSFKAVSDVAGAGSTTEQFLKNLERCAENIGNNIEKIFGAVNG